MRDRPLHERDSARLNLVKRHLSRAFSAIPSLPSPSTDELIFFFSIVGIERSLSRDCAKCAHLFPQRAERFPSSKSFPVVAAFPSGIVCFGPIAHCPVSSARPSAAQSFFSFLFWENFFCFPVQQVTVLSFLLPPPWTPKRRSKSGGAWFPGFETFPRLFPSSPCGSILFLSSGRFSDQLVPLPSPIGLQNSTWSYGFCFFKTLFPLLGGRIERPLVG